MPNDASEKHTRIDSATTLHAAIAHICSHNPKANVLFVSTAGQGVTYQSGAMDYVRAANPNLKIIDFYYENNHEVFNEVNSRHLIFGGLIDSLTQIANERFCWLPKRKQFCKEPGGGCWNMETMDYVIIDYVPCGTHIGEKETWTRLIALIQWIHKYTRTKVVLIHGHTVRNDSPEYHGFPSMSWREYWDHQYNMLGLKYLFDTKSYWDHMGKRPEKRGGPCYRWVYAF